LPMDERTAGASPAPAEVRGATPADVEALARALAAAFEDDAIFGWRLPDRKRRYDRLLRFFGLELEDVVLPSGAGWMSAEGAGACLELPPGGWRMPLRTQALHAPRFVAVFGRSLPRALLTITKMERRHLRESHVYVPYVGVAPEAQGAGLGTRLLERTLEGAGARGLPTYLEATSEQNAALYARLGFEHLGAFTVLGSPPLWPMRRPPSQPLERPKASAQESSERSGSFSATRSRKGRRSMFAALARLADRRPRSICLLALVFFGVAAAFGGSVADHLDPFGAETQGTESIRARQALERAGLRVPAVLMVLRDAPTPSGRTERRVFSLMRRVERMPHIAYITNYYTSGNRAFIARGRRTTQMVIRSDPLDAKHGQ